MAASFLDSIDWTRPWFASIRPAAEQIIAHDDWLTALNERSKALGLDNHRGLPLSFVDQASLPPGSAYESFISATGCIPTRDNPHDFFNALVWLSFPRIKRQINALQAAQIERRGVGSSRGAARDAATILDENAALLVVSGSEQGGALARALREHAWQAAFIDQGESFGRHAEVWLFGHALLEKLLTPYKAITAHAWLIEAPEDFHSKSRDARREWMDEQVASELAAELANGDGSRLDTARFTPLPVLGIPGWWPGQDRAFYADATVFRPRRSSRA